MILQCAHSHCSGCLKGSSSVGGTINDCDVAHVLTHTHSNNRFAKNVFFVLLHL